MSMWWLVGRRHASWRTIRFRLPTSSSWLASVGRVVGIAGAAFLCVLIGEQIIVAIFDQTSFHIKSNVKELLPSGQSTIDLAQYLVLVGVGAVLAPITEETLFRGVLFQGMRRDASGALGSAGGLIVAAVVSGLLLHVHLIGGSSELYTLPLLAYLGIVLAFAFYYSDSLGGSMLVHAAVNFISITFLFAHAHWRRPKQPHLATWKGFVPVNIGQNTRGGRFDANVRWIGRRRPASVPVFEYEDNVTFWSRSVRRPLRCGAMVLVVAMTSLYATSPAIAGSGPISSTPPPIEATSPTPTATPPIPTPTATTPPSPTPTPSPTSSPLQPQPLLSLRRG